MIVLDAGVLIALWNRDDVHYGAARTLLQAHDSGVMHPVNLGESLVYAVQRSDEERARSHLGQLRIRPSAALPDEAFLLARARAATGLRMPDCCALVCAEHLSLPLATFDRRLAEGARARGVTVLPERLPT